MNLQRIRKNKQLNTLLMHECDIYFYEEVRALQFVNNHEIYSMVCDAFAQDGSGGEYVFLEDGSIGFISRRGRESGRERGISVDIFNSRRMHFRFQLQAFL